MRKPVSFERLQKVSDVAAAMDPPVPYATLLGRLKEIHAANPGTWLVCTGRGNGARYYVSMEDLRQAHPKLFERTHATRDEVTFMAEKVKELEGELARVRMNANKFRTQALDWMERVAKATGVRLP